MLILSRKPGDAILVGDGIRIVVVSSDRGGVRLGIEAPADVTILREEIVQQIAEENRRANESPDRAEWLDLIVQKPGLYLQVRADVFRWVLQTPVIDRCLPVHLGVGGPAKAMADLGMTDRFTPRDQRLYNYVTWFLDTPAMSHVAFAGIALVVGVVLLIRREPADLMIAGLMAGALAFAASFFVISLACDYRYLYLLDIAAITGALYLALDPRLRRAV